jgi:hypothetical protein
MLILENTSALVVSTKSFSSVGLGSSPGLLCRIMISFVIWPNFYVFFSSTQPRPRPPAHSRRPARPARRKFARPPPRLPSALPVALAMWAWPRTRCYRCMLPAPARPPPQPPPPPQPQPEPAPAPPAPQSGGGAGQWAIWTAMPF